MERLEPDGKPVAKVGDLMRIITPAAHGKVFGKVIRVEPNGILAFRKDGSYWPRGTYELATDFRPGDRVRIKQVSSLIPSGFADVDGLVGGVGVVTDHSCGTTKCLHVEGVIHSTGSPWHFAEGWLEHVDSDEPITARKLQPGDYVRVCYDDKVYCVKSVDRATVCLRGPGAYGATAIELATDFRPGDHVKEKLTGIVGKVKSSSDCTFLEHSAFQYQNENLEHVGCDTPITTTSLESNEAWLLQKELENAKNDAEFERNKAKSDYDGVVKNLADREEECNQLFESLKSALNEVDGLKTKHSAVLRSLVEASRDHQKFESELSLAKNELILAEAEVERLKLKLAERPMPVPPDSLLEKVAGRCVVEAKALGRFCKRLASKTGSLVVQAAKGTRPYFSHIALGLAIMVILQIGFSLGRAIDQTTHFMVPCPGCGINFDTTVKYGASGSFMRVPTNQELRDQNGFNYYPGKKVNLWR